MTLSELKPLAIELFAGLHGWGAGASAEGFRCAGFDIVDMCEEIKRPRPHGCQLVIQDVLTIHGSQFKDASLIVASPPCQEFSYMAMPWSKAKQLQRDYETGVRDVKKLTALFDACFRIQREAIEAAGHFIPLIVENVRGAQKWVGRSRWNYGSFHLWGDVPALMPITSQAKVPGYEHGRFPGGGLAQGAIENGIKQGGDWFAEARKGGDGGTSASFGSRSPARKAASAMIAQIPFDLARWIARAWRPRT